MKKAWKQFIILLIAFCTVLPFIASIVSMVVPQQPVIDNSQIVEEFDDGHEHSQ